MKKGFTLIELLGTIVVLAIIALVTIPIISGVVNKARLNSLKNSAYGLIDASNLYYAQYGVSNNIRFDIDDNKVLSNDVEEDKMLSYRGSIKEGTVIINTKGKTTVCVTDGKNSAYKNYNESSVTLVSSKRCSVPENTNIVYLDGDATTDDTDINELIDRINNLEEKMITIDDIYPVGSYYISGNNTNPANLFGGTWKKIEDRFLLASGTNTLGTTGGNSSVQYTPAGTVGNHTLTVDEMPSHSHPFDYTVRTSQGSYSYVTKNSGTSSPGGISDFNRPETVSVGGSQPHTHSFTGTATNINTMPPYLVVNVWKRTA